jgi:hypothetical protein
MVTKTMHFSVCGEGLTGIVRQMYCFEGKQLQALNILENLQGISISQSKDVCEGRARLEETKDGMMRLINDPDEEFIRNYAKHQAYQEKKSAREAEEAMEMIRGLENPLTDVDNAYAIGQKVGKIRCNNPRLAEILRSGISVKAKDGSLTTADDYDFVDAAAEHPHGTCQGALEYAAAIGKTDIVIAGAAGEYSKKLARVNRAMKSAKTIREFADAPNHFNYTEEESLSLLEGMVDPEVEKVPGLNKEVTITSDELLEKLCYCEVCKEHPKDGKDTCLGRRDEYCSLYRERLYQTYPVGEAVTMPAGEIYPVMGGYVPKKLLDDYSNAIADRLRALGKKPRRADSIRPIYQIDELEEQRRALHIAMLSNAGFMPLECGHAATAFKMVIEHFIEERMKRLGLL